MTILQSAARTRTATADAQAVPASALSVSPGGLCAHSESAARSPDSEAVAEPVELVPPAQAPGSASLSLMLADIYCTIQVDRLKGAL